MWEHGRSGHSNRKVTTRGCWERTCSRRPVHPEEVLECPVRFQDCVNAAYASYHSIMHTATPGVTLHAKPEQAAGRRDNVWQYI